ncbi:MAG: FtsQ-type POTRA domain-containing protein [Candidatus Parcubacteria bacterium]|nr:FtsQ-type POTRA domain-containing protein [Candidatus Parcubacteria bacterium]
MFFKRKKKNLLFQKKYKVERGKVYYRRPHHFKINLFKFNLFSVINLILLIGIISCLYFFIFSNFYNITNIEIYGNQIISTDDLLDITNNYLNQNTFFIFKNRNIFLFSKNQLIKRINEVVLLTDIKIEKILPNTLRVTIKEKNAALKWQGADLEYLIDNQGQIIKKFYKTSIPKIFQLNVPSQGNKEEIEGNFLKIIDLANEGVNLGDFVLRPENIGFILDLNDQLSQKDYLKPNNITVPNKMPQFLIIELNTGAKLFFNLVDTLANQLSRLNLLIDKKIKQGNLKNLDYIDLRMGENVYYKMK